MKGIILAGGGGTRLYPSTLAVSKQLLAVYDKPMIYYPLSTLMLAGIRDVLVISSPQFVLQFEKLLGDGSEIGLNITYAVQSTPRGLADAFIVGEDFIGSSNVCLVLGDNIFYGYDLSTRLESAAQLQKGAIVFGCYVANPSDFAVIEFDKENNVVSIEEKPLNPKSNYSIPGLYFYDNDVIEIAKQVKPSQRGEIEITSVNKMYLEQGRLKVKLFGRGTAWFDTGTHKSMLSAANFIEAVQTRQGLYVSCIEEIAYRKGFINQYQLKCLGEKLKQNEYGEYILRIASGQNF